MVTPFTARSTAITRTPFAIAVSTAPVTASESHGLMIRTLIPFATRSSTSLTCFVTSSLASTTEISTPRSAAAFSAPSASVTKNGLFSVDTERPMEPLPTTSAGSLAAAKLSAFSAVTRVTSTGMEVGIVSPAISFIALSTAVLPISAGCWAIVPSMRPSLIAAIASSVASKPITMMSLPAPEIASTAPRAISSFAANTAWMSPFA